MVPRVIQYVPKVTQLPLGSPVPEVLSAQPGNFPQCPALLPSNSPDCSICNDRVQTFFNPFPPPCLVPSRKLYSLAKLNSLQTPHTMAVPLLPALAPMGPLPGILFLHLLHSLSGQLPLFQDSYLVSPVPRSLSWRPVSPSPLWHPCGVCTHMYILPSGCLSDGGYCVIATYSTHQILSAVKSCLCSGFIRTSSGAWPKGI